MSGRPSELMPPLSGCSTCSCFLAGVGEHDHEESKERCHNYTRLEDRYTYGTCTSVTIDKFADAMLLIYKKWDDNYEYKHLLNGHFRPQIGPESCFNNVQPSDYDVVSTIGNTAAMVKFSEHLPAHTLGLWGHAGEHSNAHGNLYFEGEPFKVCKEAIQKLEMATRREREVLHTYI